MKGEERDYSTDENKIKFARSFLNAIHNEETGVRKYEEEASSNYSKVRTKKPETKKPEGTPRTIFPSDAFITLNN